MARQIIYKTLSAYVKKDGTPAVWELDGIKTDFISAIFDLEDKSRSTKNSEYFIATLGLSYIYTTLVNVLSMMNYDITNQPNKKSMRVHDIRYRINDKYCFFIQIKTGAHSYITFQSVESVIGLQNLPENESDMIDDIALYEYTREEFLKGLKNAQTRILYSASTISRTMFNRQNKKFEYTARKYTMGNIKYHGQHVRKNVAMELFCRPAVHGGINFVSFLGYNYQGKGIVLDCNSLYPDRATHCRLPGTRLIEYNTGAPKNLPVNSRRLFYMIWKVEVSATLKENGIPCIQADGQRTSMSTDYLTKMSRRVLTLTQADRDMLYENYNITYFRIKEYMMWDTQTKDFKKYIENLYKIKQTEKGVKRNFAKLMQNGLIGTFGKQVYKDDTVLAYDDDGNVYPEKRSLSPEEYIKNLSKTSGLCYINCAIVSEARLKMVRLIKKYRDRFLYTDTDSLHLSGADIPDDIPISDKMGDFKIEHTFEKVFYKTVKNYIMIENGQIILTCAGVPKDSLKHLYDNQIDCIDYRGIQKCILSHDIKGLYNYPIPVRKIHEDATNGQLFYHTSATMLSGIKEELEEALHVSKKSNIWDHQFTWYEDLKDNIDFWDAFNERYGKSATTPFNNYTEEREFLKFVHSGKWQNAQEE